jgi:catechol 2,3-dioxygenase-like lactoylglutathione lyase family enzyme
MRPQKMNLNWPGSREAANTTPRMHHMGLTVSDIDQSARFYERLGFRRLAAEPLALGDEWVGELLGARGAAVRILMLALGEGVLELAQYDRPDGGQRTPLSTWDAGAAHVAVQVSDVWPIYRELVAEGVIFNHEPITIPNGELAGTVCLYGRDPDGNMFELIAVAEAGGATDER